MINFPDTLSTCLAFPLSFLTPYNMYYTYNTTIINTITPPPPPPPAPSGGGPGRATLPGIGNSASWKAALWTRLDRLVNSILKAYGQIHQLYLVLTKKRDPITQVSFLESIAEVIPQWTGFDLIPSFVSGGRGGGGGGILGVGGVGILVIEFKRVGVHS